MALRYKIGGITGGADSPTLPVTVWENAGADVDVEDALEFVASVVPESVLSCLRDAAPSIERVARHIYRIGVGYSAPNAAGSLSQPPPRATGELARSANFQARSQQVRYALEPIGVYDESGDVTDDYPHTKWKVSTNLEGSAYVRVDGITVDPLPETRTLDFFAPNSTINDAYLDALESCMGAFNSTPFFDRPQGSVQLVRFSISQRTPDDWELSFGFGYKAPETGRELDGVTIPELRGSWIFWTNEIWSHNEEIHTIEPKTELVVVQRVWPEVDLATILDLPAEVTYPVGDSE